MLLVFISVLSCANPEREANNGQGGTGGSPAAGGTGEVGGSTGIGGTGAAGGTQGGIAGSAAGGSGRGGTQGVAGSGPAGRGGATGVAGSGPAGRGGATGVAGSGAGGSPPAQAGTLMGDVALSVPSQAYKGQLTIGLSTTIPNAEIRYTTDGTLPTATSTLYASPFMISLTTQVRAQPFVSGAAAGLVTTGLYIARSFDLTSKLPIVLLDHYGKGTATEVNQNNATNKRTYRDAAVMIFEPVNGTASVANLPTVATRASFHLRGQSSAGFPQKPYKVEFRDNGDNDAKYAIAGMAADADWALIPPYYDRSLLRNPFTYGLGRDMGMSAPHTAFAEAFLNFSSPARAISMDDYQGVYWWSETIKINGHRTDLADLKATDTTEPEITGGYIFKFDQLATDPMSPRPTCKASTGVTCWTDCELTDPVPLPAPTEQLAYLTNYLQSFHNTLFTTPLGNYGQYIDINSFVDYMIISELTRNTDAYVRSAYFSKDKNALLKGGPLWDYNFALGVGGSNTYSATPATTNDGGWNFQGKTAGSLPSRNVSSWFPKLMTDPAFQTKAKARWKSLRTGLLSQAQIETRLNTLHAQLPAESMARDFAKWPVSTPYPNGGAGGTGIRVYSVSYDPMWENQVKALHDWILARAAWMDSQWQ